MTGWRWFRSWARSACWCTWPCRRSAPDAPSPTIPSTWRYRRRIPRSWTLSISRSWVKRSATVAAGGQRRYVMRAIIRYRHCVVFVVSDGKSLKLTNVYVCVLIDIYVYIYVCVTSELVVNQALWKVFDYVNKIIWKYQHTKKNICLTYKYVWLIHRIAIFHRYKVVLMFSV